uniref:T-cell immunoglobulin and mucin domain-containing protein 4-like isoform X1 n=1 Tax=Doryrhamphus excisus TaxID=161450 RepID=UPI0025ADBAD1|nr:T-cell immunoglobulin and mucin domain-containing protein 4-like isoform X1 [Doryrhamphus excisus]
MTSPVGRLLALACGLTLLLGCEFQKLYTAPFGANVTLDCYDEPKAEPLTVCWGRGLMEDRQDCKDEMIRTDGKMMVSRSSERYNFAGNIAEGNLSMTIMDVKEDDSGLYVCVSRTQIMMLELRVAAPPPTMAATPSAVIVNATPTMAATPSAVTVNATPTTSVDEKKVNRGVLAASIVTPLALVMLAVAMVTTWYIKTRTASVDLLTMGISGEIPYEVGSGHGVVLTKYTRLDV